MEAVSPVQFDPASPFFLHHSDNPGVILVLQLLTGDNYASWSRAMILALSVKNKLGFVDGSITKPDGIDLVLFNSWTRNNHVKATAALRRINLEGLQWRVFDAKGQVLGRLASHISTVIQGKDKPTYTPHREDEDMCIVLNAKDVCVTGRKFTDKFYRWHTGLDYNLILYLLATQKRGV